MVVVSRVLVALLTLAASGCVVVDTDSGPTRTESRNIAVGAAETVRVEIRMGAGDVSIRRGRGKGLLESTFRYSERQGPPEVRYDLARTIGRLAIESPHGSFSTGHSTNEWRLHFGDSVPLDFKIQLGAGQCDADLSALPIRSVEIAMGAGQLELNLSGRYDRDVDVTVNGGVGQARIVLPKRFGAIADVAGGIGSVEASGLEKREGRYVNRSYEDGKPAVHLKVRGGVGQIDFSVAE